MRCNAKTHQTSCKSSTTEVRISFSSLLTKKIGRMVRIRWILPKRRVRTRPSKAILARQRELADPPETQNQPEKGFRHRSRFVDIRCIPPMPSGGPRAHWKRGLSFQRMLTTQYREFKRKYSTTCLPDGSQ